MTSSLQHEAREEILLIFRAKNKLKIIPSDHKEIIRALVRFKEGLETVEGYDHIPVPPVYSQVTLTTSLLSHSKSSFSTGRVRRHILLLHPLSHRIPTPGL